jgi:hypothetical protein
LANAGPHSWLLGRRIKVTRKDPSDDAIDWVPFADRLIE